MSRPNVIGALVALGASVGLAALYGWAAVTVHDSQADAGSAQATRPILGAPGTAFAREAELRMTAAMRELNDRSTPAGVRLERSAAELQHAERLLLAGLRARPGDASMLASLAAVRWELSPPRGAAEIERSLSVVRLASQMAPRDPAVQQRLAELLLRAGRRDEALEFARRTVELARERTASIVDLLAEQAFTAEQIHATLPDEPTTLIALHARFYRGATGAEPFLELVERSHPGLESVPSTLVPSVAAALLQTGNAERLLEILRRRDADDDATAEFVATYRARALITLDRADEALGVAVEAFDRHPDSLALALVLGDTAHAAEQGDRALEAYRRGLAIVAQGTGSTTARARLYRSIGRVEESLGRGDRAFDAYRLAVEIGQDDWSRRRLELMRGKVGR